MQLLEKMLSKVQVGNIKGYRSRQESGTVSELPTIRLDLITYLDSEFQLMNELMSLMIEFKRSALERAFEHYGQNQDQELDTCSTFSDEEMPPAEDSKEEEKEFVAP